MRPHCSQATITDAAFAHLQGIHTLNMSYRNKGAVADAVFAHLWPDLRWPQR